MNLYGYANGDPVNYADPFGLYADRQGEDSADDENMDDDDPCKQDAASDACKTQAAETCAADLKQAALSTITSVLQVGGLKYARNFLSLVRSEAAWANTTVTSSAVANFSLLPATSAVGRDVNRRGGTPNPFDGDAAVAYRFFSALPVVGAGLKLGEAINSCAAAASSAL